MPRLNIEPRLFSDWQRLTLAGATLDWSTHPNPWDFAILGMLNRLWFNSQKENATEGTAEQIRKWIGVTAKTNIVEALEAAGFISEKSENLYHIHGNAEQLAGIQSYIDRGKKGAAAKKEKRKQAQLQAKLTLAKAKLEPSSSSTQAQLEPSSSSTQAQLEPSSSSTQAQLEHSSSSALPNSKFQIPNEVRIPPYIPPPRGGKKIVTKKSLRERAVREISELLAAIHRGVRDEALGEWMSVEGSTWVLRRFGDWGMVYRKYKDACNTGTFTIFEKELRTALACHFFDLFNPAKNQAQEKNGGSGIPLPPDDEKIDLNAN